MSSLFGLFMGFIDTKKNILFFEMYDKCVFMFMHIWFIPTSLMPGVIVGAAIKTTYGANSAVRRTFRA